MKSRFADEGKPLITGWDIGGAHLKMAQCRDGEIISAKILKTPLWLGLEQTREALREIGPLRGEGNINVFTMTGELSDTFASRDAGIAGLLDFIEEEFGVGNTLIYAGRSGFCDVQRSAQPWQRYRFRQLARHRKPECEADGHRSVRRYGFNDHRHSCVQGWRAGQ